MQKARDFKYLADEGFSFFITSELRNSGYDVSWIGEISGGVSDRVVFKLAQDEDRIILTDDKDFGELAVRFNLKIGFYRGNLIIFSTCKA